MVISAGMYQPYQDFLSEMWSVEATGSNAEATIWNRYRLVCIKLGAGVLSGTTGAIAGNPFELLKVRMQHRPKCSEESIVTIGLDIVRNEGLKGLYRGVIPACFRSSLLTSSQLLTYDVSKLYLVSKFGLDGATYTCQVGCALISGIAATTMSTPADVIKTRMMVASSATGPTPIAVLRHSWQEGSLFRGWTGNYIRLGPHTLIVLVVYERLRKFFGWSDM